MGRRRFRFCWKLRGTFDSISSSSRFTTTSRSSSSVHYPHFNQRELWRTLQFLLSTSSNKDYSLHHWTLEQSFPFSLSSSFLLTSTLNRILYFSRSTLVRQQQRGGRFPSFTKIIPLQISLRTFHSSSSSFLLLFEETKNWSSRCSRDQTWWEWEGFG